MACKYVKAKQRCLKLQPRQVPSGGAQAAFALSVAFVIHLVSAELERKLHLHLRMLVLDLCLRECALTHPLLCVCSMSDQRGLFYSSV